MVHRKEKHKERVKNCLYYSNGTCVFSDEDCWYQHTDPKSSVSKTLTEYKCSLCEKTFNSKPEFMKHRKNEHPNNISICAKYENDNCHFGDDHCWYKHAKQNILNNDIINDSPEIIHRIFGLMEKFTERFENIETQL